MVDNKGNLATIKDGFPLEHDGSETLTFRIANENGTLTSLKPLIVTSSPITFDQSTRQILTLDLRSKFAIDSSNNPKLGTYGIGTIDESVKKILIENKSWKIEEAQISNSKGKVEHVKNYNIKKMVKIKVSLKQVGADRIANAISISDKKNNYINLHSWF